MKNGLALGLIEVWILGGLVLLAYVLDPVWGYVLDRLWDLSHGVL
jgi:hypothetical protein